MTASWEDFVVTMTRGRRLTVRVLQHVPYGVIVDVGHPEFRGVILLPELVEPPVKAIRPPVGTELEATVVTTTEHNREVRLTLRGGRV
jgi:ribosomal protein S1